MAATLGSLFDGSGGFPLAGSLHGITPIWSSEIEPFPLKVTAARFPHVQQLGSVLDIDGAKIPPVDVITFGSPCQDLSIAGKREGIHEGKRSNLFFEAVRIIKEMRAHAGTDTGPNVDIRPRFAVWENVPGAFSSNKGADFRAVLQALAEVTDPGVSIPQPSGKWKPAGCIVGNGYSIAWRVYDAQYWGVPQRRKRIYLVADFASERAGEILFKSESVCGDYSESTETRQGTANDAAGSVGGSNVLCFKERAGKPGGGKGILINQDHHTFTLSTNIDQSIAYHTNSPDAAGTVYAIDPISSNSMKSANPQSGFHEETYFRCLDTSGGNPICNQGGNIIIQTAHRTQPAKPQRKHIVRRLTPLECCRLQGFPDWWTDGVEGSDAARYRMWGNGIALPCAADVLKRIAKAMEGEQKP